MNSIGHNETYSELRRLRMILSRTRTYEGTIKWSIIEIWTQKVQLERFSVFFKIKKNWVGAGLARVWTITIYFFSWPYPVICATGSVMPSFHHSVAVLPLPFRRCHFIVLCRCRSSVP